MEIFKKIIMAYLGPLHIGAKKKIFFTNVNCDINYTTKEKISYDCKIGSFINLTIPNKTVF